MTLDASVSIEIPRVLFTSLEITAVCKEQMATVVVYLLADFKRTAIFISLTPAELPVLRRHTFVIALLEVAFHPFVPDEKLETDSSAIEYRASTIKPVCARDRISGF